MPSLKIAARYFFAVIILALIFRIFDGNRILASVSAADIGNMSIAIGFALTSQLLTAIRLNRLLLLQGIALSLGQVFLIGLSAVFYGLVVPGGTLAAFAVRFTQLSRGVPLESAAAALVIDRLMATAFLIVIGTIAIGFDQADLIWAGVIAVVTVFCVGAFVFGRGFLQRLIDLVDNALSHDLSSRLHRFAKRTSGAFLRYSMIGIGQILMVLALSLLAHLSGCLMYFTISTGMDLNISFLSICWIRSGMILCTMIPVSVAGLGLREVAAIGLLVPLGVIESQAVGFSILIFLVTPVIVGLIGGIGELLRAIGRR